MIVREPRCLILPAAVERFVRAVNGGDLDGLVETFAESALVNDQLCEYRGREAIKRWARREVVGQALSMHVMNVVTRHDQSAVEASIDGSFDKRGLPDPLIVSFYFSTQDEAISQLNILRNEPAP
ncbi:MAG TPA: nuclear transport factor 2 family protein [Polyangiaceae bacterium]|nr:nuclear transport factor 2 family protein [Polyangiaceae bacterium]